MDKMNKTKAVLIHLQHFGSITSMEAIEKFGATRLSAIILNLRKRGHKINTENVSFTDRFGRKSSCAKYVLVKEES